MTGSRAVFQDQEAAHDIVVRFMPCTLLLFDEPPVTPLVVEVIRHALIKA